MTAVCNRLDVEDFEADEAGGAELRGARLAEGACAGLFQIREIVLTELDARRLRADVKALLALAQFDAADFDGDRLRQGANSSRRIRLYTGIRSRQKPKSVFAVAAVGSQPAASMT